jgi:16S rRNA G966 N2-methylase RsmD
VRPQLRILVDLDPDALAAVRLNLAAVGLDGEPATLVRAALPGWLESAAAGSFDLALCDPPYTYEDWPALLGALRADTVVMESAATIVLPASWVVARERRYGGTLVTVAHRTADDS